MSSGIDVITPYRVLSQVQNSSGVINKSMAEQVSAGRNNTGAELDRANGARVERAMKRSGINECQTCKQRQYQDVSNDPGVSFKSPAHLSPETAAGAVSAHESQHVAHEKLKADRENREILAQYVQIYTSVCPECGRTYISGGKTTTVTASRQSQAEDTGWLMDQYI